MHSPFDGGTRTSDPVIERAERKAWETPRTVICRAKQQLAYINPDFGILDMHFAQTGRFKCCLPSGLFLLYVIPCAVYLPVLTKA